MTLVSQPNIFVRINPERPILDNNSRIPIRNEVPDQRKEVRTGTGVLVRFNSSNFGRSAIQIAPKVAVTVANIKTIEEIIANPVIHLIKFCSAFNCKRPIAKAIEKPHKTELTKASKF